MAFTQVPVLYDALFDPFDDSLWDFTFPPRRYARLTQDGGHHHGRRENQVARREQQDKFKVSLHVGRYKPEEISLRVTEGTLFVTGKHFNEGENGFESSQFQRQYTFPDDVDENTLKSMITGDGVLKIEACKKQVEVTKDEDSSEFKVCVPTAGYKPENISVKLNERNLVIEAQEKEETDDHFHSKQLTRQFVLPKDVDAEQLKTELMKDGTLVVKAPRNPALLPQERVLPIETAKDQGAMEQ